MCSSQAEFTMSGFIVRDIACLLVSVLLLIMLCSTQVRGSACSVNYCQTCRGTSAFQCVTCNTGYYLVSITTTTNRCTSCLNGCGSCTNGTVCIACNAGYGSSSGGGCTTCATSNCQSCTADYTTCTGCVPNYMLVAGTNGASSSCSACSSVSSPLLQFGYTFVSDGVQPCHTCLFGRTS